MTDDTETPTEISRIDTPYRASGIGDVEVEPGHGVMMKTLPQMIEAAKLIAKADIALPPHARNRPEICFAIMMKTENWKLRDPFFVAEHSYVVTQKRLLNGSWQEIDTLAYDSAVFQAALLASGAIKGRPNYFYEGEGDERRCTVEVMDRRTGELHNMVSPPLIKAHPGHTEKGHVRGSPLWDRNPDQQLAYYTLRNLVRLKFQDVLAGFYDKDEYAEYSEPTPPPSDSFLERLKQKNRAENGPEPTEHHEPTLDKAMTINAEPKRRRKARNPEAYKEGWEKRRANAAKRTEIIKEAAETDPEREPEFQAAKEAQDEPPEEEGATLPLEPEPAPTPALGRARRPQPTTQAEYIDYAERCIRGYGTEQLLRWFGSPSEKARQQACGINKFTHDRLLVMINEKIAKAKPPASAGQSPARP